MRNMMIEAHGKRERQTNEKQKKRGKRTNSARFFNPLSRIGSECFCVVLMAAIHDQPAYELFGASVCECFYVTLNEFKLIFGGVI